MIYSEGNVIYTLEKRLRDILTEREGDVIYSLRGKGASIAFHGGKGRWHAFTERGRGTWYID